MVTSELITKLQESDGDTSIVLIAEEGIYAIDTITNANTSTILTLKHVKDASEYMDSQGTNLEDDAILTEALNMFGALS